MSVTFWVPAAPSQRLSVPCDYGLGEPWACSPERRCGYCTDGEDVQTVSLAPSLNVSNVTAGVLLDLLRLPHEPGGTVVPSAIPSVRRRIVLALSTGRPEAEALPGGDSGGPGTGQARFISLGLDGEQIRERLTRLDAVFAYAQEHGQEVSWG